MRHLEASIEILTKLDQSVVLAWAYREMGLTLEPSDRTQAIKCMKMAIEAYERADEAVELAITYRHMGDMLSESNRKARACDAYRQGILALEKNL